jgi:hypothetical protein
MEYPRLCARTLRCKHNSSKLYGAKSLFQMLCLLVAHIFEIKIYNKKNTCNIKAPTVTKLNYL